MSEYNYLFASTATPIEASILWGRISVHGARMHIMEHHRNAELIFYLKYHINLA